MGDEAGKVFCEHLGLAYRVALAATGSPTEAEDAVQDSYLRFVRGWAAFDRSRPVQPYLARVVVNTAAHLGRAELRRAAREQARVREDAMNSTGTLSVSAEELAALRSAVAALPAGERLAVSLHYLEGLTIDDTAAALAVPRTTAANRVQKGLDELKRVLSQAGFGALAAPAALAALPRPEAPAALSSAVRKLMNGQAAGTGTSAATAAAKGGFIVKIGLGVAAAGLAAGATFWAVGGKAEDKSAPPAVDWKAERWAVEDFSCAIGGGPLGGHRLESGLIGECAGDKDGNLYVGSGNRIFAINAEGRVYWLAGTGAKGRADGPAEQATFRLGETGYYGAWNLGCDERGNIFVADSGTIRRIYKDKDGHWLVETWAGGGKTKLSVGGSCPPKELAPSSGPTVVAVAPDGAVTFSSAYNYYRVSPDGKTVTCLGAWRMKDKDVGLMMQKGDCDRQGNAYFVNRENVDSQVYRVSADGKFAHVAGTWEKDRKRRDLHDGPPLEAFFNTFDSGVVDPNGLCFYGCGGDEYDIRRIPTDLATPTTTLMQNGAWATWLKPGGMSGMSTKYDPNKTDKLVRLQVCHLHGRDREGNLYGSLYPWCGASFDGGKTKMFKIGRKK